MSPTLRLIATTLALSLSSTMAIAEAAPASEGVRRLIFAHDLAAVAEEEHDALMMLSAYWLRASVALGPAKLTLTPLPAYEAAPGPRPDLTNAPVQDTPAQLLERARALAGGDPAILELIELGAQDPAVIDTSAQGISLQLAGGAAGALDLTPAQGQITLAVSTDAAGLHINLRGEGDQLLCAGPVAAVALCDVASESAAQLQLINQGNEALTFNLVLSP